MMTSKTNPEVCGQILDLASLRPAGRLSEHEATQVEEHLQRCTICHDEVRFMDRVHEARVRVPFGLSERIMAGIRSDRGSRTRRPAPWWSAPAAAAAVLVLAFSSGVLVQSTTSLGAGWDALAGGDPFMESSEDWYVAGAPLLDGVSDETLMALYTDSD